MIAGGYALLDSGNRARLESFGGRVLSRPCPSATWRPGLPSAEWQAAELSLTADGWSGADAGGEWRLSTESGFSLDLWPGENGQVGAFPEQWDNWRWLKATCEAAGSTRRLRVLNLFAYTGGSTLACAASGAADVAHVDGARAAVSRARANAELSGLAAAPVRWLAEDALTFVERAVRRGEAYDGVVLDPPAFGRGGAKKKVDWRIERDLERLLRLLGDLLGDEPVSAPRACPARRASVPRPPYHDRGPPETRCCARRAADVRPPVGARPSLADREDARQPRRDAALAARRDRDRPDAAARGRRRRRPADGRLRALVARARGPPFGVGLGGTHAGNI